MNGKPGWMNSVVSPLPGSTSPLLVDRERFERARRGGADRDHAPPFTPGPVHRIGGVRRHLVMLRLDAMIFHAIDANGLERSVADMQRHGGALDAAGRQRVEQLRRKVQAGGGRRNRASRSRVDGLIAIAIGGHIRALDVRRQRNVTDRIDRLPHRRSIVGPQTNRATAVEMPCPALPRAIAARRIRTPCASLRAAAGRDAPVRSTCQGDPPDERESIRRRRRRAAGRRSTAPGTRACR